MQSTERKKYHEMIVQFKKMIPPRSVVYDIGKSVHHDYKSSFENFWYRCIDKDAKKIPDIILDIEDRVKVNDFVGRNLRANGLLCNGVLEQCSNPVEMIRGCGSIMHADAVALFGFVSVCYPIYDNDRFRFTPMGARMALEISGFEILSTEEVCLDGNPKKPTYVYLLCHKNGE